MLSYFYYACYREKGLHTEDIVPVGFKFVINIIQYDEIITSRIMFLRTFQLIFLNYSGMYSCKDVQFFKSQITLKYY